MADPLRFSKLPTPPFLRFHCLRGRCPPVPAGGWFPSLSDKDRAVGADPHFKQSYNMEKLGFTRNVGDYLLYVSTLHATKRFTYFD